MIFKTLLSQANIVLEDKSLTEIFTAIFYEHVVYDSYLQLVIVPKDNMLLEFVNNSIIIFVEADFVKDSSFINLPLLKTKPDISIQSSNVFPVMQTVGEIEDGAQSLITEPLSNMLLIDGLTNDINLMALKYDLYVREMNFIKQGNSEDNDGSIIHISDINKEYQNTLMNAENSIDE